MLNALGVPFALVGGLAVSLRAEVRFTRDIDLAVRVTDDAQAEQLVFELRAAEYDPLTVIEHESQKRLATARLLSPSGILVDLLFATSGIEAEVTSRATEVEWPPGERLPVARSEELLATKILSMTPQRLQDRMDAMGLLAMNTIDATIVRHNLNLIEERGYHRGQDLMAKFDALLKDIAERSNP